MDPRRFILLDTDGSSRAGRVSTLCVRRKATDHLVFLRWVYLHVAETRATQARYGDKRGNGGIVELTAKGVGVWRPSCCGMVTLGISIPASRNPWDRTIRRHTPSFSNSLIRTCSRLFPIFPFRCQRPLCFSGVLTFIAVPASSSILTSTALVSGKPPVMICPFQRACLLFPTALRRVSRRPHNSPSRTSLLSPPPILHKEHCVRESRLASSLSFHSLACQGFACLIIIPSSRQNRCHTRESVEPCISPTDHQIVQSLGEPAIRFSPLAIFGIVESL